MFKAYSKKENQYVVLKSLKSTSDERAKDRLKIDFDYEVKLNEVRSKSVCPFMNGSYIPIFL